MLINEGPAPCSEKWSRRHTEVCRSTELGFAWAVLVYILFDAMSMVVLKVSEMLSSGILTIIA